MEGVFKDIGYIMLILLSIWIVYGILKKIFNILRKGYELITNIKEHALGIKLNLKDISLSRMNMNFKSGIMKVLNLIKRGPCIKSFDQFLLAILILSMTLSVLLIGNNGDVLINSKLSFIIVVTVFFLSVLVFLHRDFKNIDSFDKTSIVYLKIVLYVIFMVSFVGGMLVNNILGLIILSIFIFVYSFGFLKGILNIFGKYSIVVFLLVYMFNIFVISYSFGEYYISNYSSFGIEHDLSFINNLEFTIQTATLKCMIGGKYLFSYPELSMNSIKGLKYFLPYYEFLLGVLYNMLYVGMFISYFSSIVFKNKDNKVKNNKIEVSVEAKKDSPEVYLEIKSIGNYIKEIDDEN